jgi:hypothetical protein
MPNRLVLFRNIVGAQDIYVEQVSGLPQLVIKFHREKMAQFGFEHRRRPTLRFDLALLESSWFCVW